MVAVLVCDHVDRVLDLLSRRQFILQLKAAFDLMQVRVGDGRIRIPVPGNLADDIDPSGEQVPAQLSADIRIQTERDLTVGHRLFDIAFRRPGQHVTDVLRRVSA